MINRLGFLILIGLNALFVILITIEWSSLSQDTSTALALTQAQVPDEENESLPAMDLSEQTEDLYTDLVERPLFIKGRRPVNEPITDNGTPEPIKTTKTLGWDLTGIYKTPKGTTAFFTRIGGKLAKDNYRKCQLNDELDGWKISDIRSDSVRLSLLGEDKMLPLRKKKPKVDALAHRNTPLVPQETGQTPAQSVTPEIPLPGMITQETPSEEHFDD
jgi:hypothetical protein